MWLRRLLATLNAFVVVELITQLLSASTRMPYARSVTRLATWPKFFRAKNYSHLANKEAVAN